MSVKRSDLSREHWNAYDSALYLEWCQRYCNSCLGLPRQLPQSLRSSLYQQVMDLPHSGRNNLNAVDMFSVPSCTKDFITEPKDKQIVDNFLAQIVIDAKNFIFAPMAVECSLQLS